MSRAQAIWVTGLRCILGDIGKRSIYFCNIPMIIINILEISGDIGLKEIAAGLVDFNDVQVLEIRRTECLLFPIADVQVWSRVGSSFTS
jgi:hypothetical protein